MQRLGKLVEVDVRELWRHEQYDFSDWLAKDENLALLNETIGLTLADVQKETFVGSYRADLVAKDETSNIKVLIENQLEATNHDHLGKIVTYASGLDADVVVWIVKTAREEHRAAIEWLNQKTVDDVSFFLLEIHAYRIGDSLPAPMFEVVAKPNDFTKALSKTSGNREISRVEAERMEFWTQLNELLVKRGKPFNPRKASIKKWYDVAIGTSEAHLTLTLSDGVEGKIDVGLYIRDDKDLFDRLEEQAPQIEDELGFALEWLRLDSKKASRIRHYIVGLDFKDHSNYPVLMDELIAKVVQMRKVFKKYI